MEKLRINLSDSISTVFTKMADGNPGALKVLLEMIKISETGVNGLFTILNLDSLGIYGTDIYVLYNDICDRNISKTMAMISAVELGILQEEILKDACSRQDFSGKGLIPVEDIYNQMLELVPDYQTLDNKINQDI